MDYEYDWPTKGEFLFKSSGKYFQYAHFGWGDIESQFYGYSKGYKESADKLVESAIDSERIAILDTFIFPIIFLYRQYLELAMKSIYISYSEDDVKQKAKTIGKVSHNLEKLWFKIKPIIQEASTSSSENDSILVVEDYVLQFHKFDDGSFKFRYPISKNLEPMLDKEHFIDIVNLKKRMNELESFFSGVDSALDQIRSFKHEWEAEMRSNYDYNDYY